MRLARLCESRADDRSEAGGIRSDPDDDRFAVRPRAPRLDARDPVQVRRFLALAWHPMEPLASTAGRPLGTHREVNTSSQSTSLLGT